MDAMKRGDTTSASRLYADDIIRIVPKQQTLHGLQALTRGYGKWLSGTTVKDDKLKTEDVLVSEDMAVETGTYSFVLQPKAGGREAEDSQLSEAGDSKSRRVNRSELLLGRPPRLSHIPERPMRLRPRMFAAFPVLLTAACTEKNNAAVAHESDSPATVSAAREGMLPVRGGRIWYRVSGTGPGTPMVLLHGGPGAGSFYMKAFEAIGDDRPVIRYDQLGAGKSDRLTDTTLMTIPRFVEELDSLRRSLGIEKWFVNGHSWGTILALEYYKAHPERVAGIIFGGSVFDLHAFAREIDALTAQLSDSSRRAIAAWKRGASAETPAFKAATEEFYTRYVFRRPARADRDSAEAVWGVEQFNYMQGAYEFAVTGTLKDYDARADLPKIAVPVLSTAGEFDEVGPKIVEAHARMIPNARFVLYPGAAHVTTWDAREANVRDVREFLRRVDGRRRIGGH
jgi:proline iminopeptidase